MTTSDSMIVFDRALVRRRRDRAVPEFNDHSFLFDEIAERLADRLEDVRRSFPTALDLGCHDGAMGRVLAGRKGIERLVACDLSPEFARAARGIAADEEFLPFAPASFDLAVSNLSLHWVNDLPGALTQIRQTLKPDGFFCAAMLGGETLFELRRCLYEAEMEASGGVSPRVSPFAEIKDAGSLLQRAGFALPVVDSDTLTVTYSDAFALMRELRGMGETNTVLARRKVPATRGLLFDAARRYAELYAEPDGRIPVTFQVLYLAAWAPHESQQQPLKPGSGETPLGQALKGH
ncbi:methyltransferase domain-containing protein [Azospirillum doebereinerae]|uniref:Methyltransferase domain-containing protein n=1 Tax=Azospirillum doebereinerae TaxID=92933 RepID=A0A3S1CDY3_9PROT|nr:methyltransferase domain-containing protein [Azospirillum doebereinerae]MCG5241999.1 methyltransferase domain-containing protein [Azospirillum doebereinerae]RUQ65073.1 methyltransferase domain-containing protein [Azospirillum doebereinerae]